MKSTSWRDADVLIIKLREGKPSDFLDIAEGIIVHLTAKGQPLEIEILYASKEIEKKDIEVSLGGLFSAIRWVAWLKLKVTGIWWIAGSRLWWMLLGYSGAARFLRHFSEGRGDYLVIQEKLFRGMDLEDTLQEGKRAIIEPSNSVASLLGCFSLQRFCRCLPCFGIPETWKLEE